MSDFAAKQGETIVSHETRDGAIASHVTEISPGAGAHSVDVSRGALRKKFEQDLSDSYPSVWVWSDGNALAVTDHESPTPSADADNLGEYNSGDLLRREAIETPTDSKRVLVYREAAAEALDELKEECVTVHVVSNVPLVIEGDDGRGVAVAPRVKPSAIGRGVNE